MAIDITLPDDRANIFTDLSNIAHCCLSQDGERAQSFKLLFNVWEKASRDLWNLCYWNDYFRCGNIVLQTARKVNNIEAQAQLLGELGYSSMEGEDYIHAEEYFQESLEKYRSIKNHAGECKLLRYLGVLAHNQSQGETALRYYHQAQEIVKAEIGQILVDNELLIAEAELPNVIGEVYLDLREFSTSYQQFHLSLNNYQILVDSNPNLDLKKQCRYYQADPLLNLGKWHFLQGNYEQAQSYYRDCLLLSREISRTDTIASALLSLAKLAEAEGNEAEALKLARESEQAAGTEIPVARDRAARFKEKLLAKGSVLS